MDISYEIAEEEMIQGHKFEDKEIKERMGARLEISEDSMKQAIRMISYSDELYNVILNHQFASKSQEVAAGKSRTVFYTNMEDPVGEMTVEKLISFHLHIDRIYNKAEKFNGNLVCI